MLKQCLPTVPVNGAKFQSVATDNLILFPDLALLSQIDQPVSKWFFLNQLGEEYVQVKIFLLPILYWLICDNYLYYLQLYWNTNSTKDVMVHILSVSGINGKDFIRQLS